MILTGLEDSTVSFVPLPGLDASVVSAAGITVADQQQLLATLQSKAGLTAVPDTSQQVVQVRK